MFDLTNNCEDTFIYPCKSYTGDDVPLLWYHTHGIVVPLMVDDIVKDKQELRNDLKSK